MAFLLSFFFSIYIYIILYNINRTLNIVFAKISIGTLGTKKGHNAMKLVPHR